ncbi:MAG: helix-turn-helix domain-containing protein [Pseudomonadales bacterium]|nr:helix-turn-helix domain-containing protein [Pseudomonadales bacterium]
MSNIYNPFQPTLTSAGLSRFGVSLVEMRPVTPLEPFVHSYLQITTTQPTVYPVMPDGMVAVYMSSSGTMIGGALNRAVNIPLLSAGEYFGIRFYPGVIRNFFDLNLSEISDQMVDAKFFPCKKFNQLHRKVYHHQAFNKRAAECEKWLLSCYRPQPKSRFDQALSKIIRSNGCSKVGELADEISWSSRHLNRQFLQHTGLTTKTFSQIVRLQQASRYICSGSRGIADVPVELGYFDQPHLIKEFNRFYHSSPGQLFERFMSDSYNQ